MQYNAGLFERYRREACEKALEILSGEIPDNACVVFDIDNTLIDSTTSTLIRCVRDLYINIRDKDIPIFIITARSPLDREYTERQLERRSLTGYQELHLVGSGRKQDIRKDIQERGYNILLNIGDHPDDFKGGYYKHMIKLPHIG